MGGPPPPPSEVGRRATKTDPHFGHPVGAPHQGRRICRRTVSLAALFGFPSPRRGCVAAAGVDPAGGGMRSHVYALVLVVPLGALARWLRRRRKTKKQ